MKSLKILAILLMVLLPLDSIYAREKPQPVSVRDKFVGAEFQLNLHKDRTVGVKALPCLNIVTGLKVHSNLGFEVGSYYSAKHMANDFTIRKFGVHGTVVGYAPLSSDLAVKFGFGACQFMPITSHKVKGTKQHSAFIPRILGGLEMDLGKNVVGRLTVIWEQASVLENMHSSFKNDNLHLNLGLAYIL